MTTELPPQPSGLISRRELVDLAQHRGGPHVSIYLPTERAGPSTRESPIRLKNLLRTAEEELIAGKMRPTEARDLLAPVRALEDDYDFWQQQSDGLAIHVAPGFYAQRRLPLRFPELAVVSERFHVRPLLELFTADAYFYLLAISMGDVRVFRCSRYSEQQLSVADMPRSMADALWADDLEKQRQFRSMYAAQSGETGLYYNSEDALQQQKEQMFRYFRQVDQSLHHLLHDEAAPLVLAAVDYLHPIYADANTYAHLLREGVAGNPEGVHPNELRTKAWQVIEPTLKQVEAEAVARFEALQGTGRTSAQLDEIAREAARGRVDTLMIAREGVAWGRVAADGGIELHERPQPGDEDVVDFCALQAVLQGGRLHVLGQDAMPTPALAAATFRY